MPLTVVTPPAAEPLTVAEAKNWLKVDHNADDSLIETLISAAREKAEHYCNAKFITTTVKESFSASVVMVQLAVGPTLEITAVQAGDTALVEGTDYQVTTTDTSTTIRILKTVEEPVSVTYTAGFGATAASLPKSIIQAIKLMLTDWYENRIDAVRNLPTASTHLLNTQRRWTT